MLFSRFGIRRMGQAIARLPIVYVLYLSVGVVLYAGCQRTSSLPEDPPDAFQPSVVKNPDDVTQRARKFFVDWLAAGGEKEIVNDESGVGIKGNATRIWAFLRSETQTDDGSPLIEIEFRVVFPDGREVVELVGGTGKTRDDAVDMAFTNFTLSTLHVVYSCFLNPNDNRIERYPLTINAEPWTLYSAGVMTLSGEDVPDFDEVAAEIRGLLGETPLNQQVHWVKVMYGRGSDGKVFECAATLDNEPSRDLSISLAKLNWPVGEGHYLAKQFLVLRPGG